MTPGARDDATGASIAGWLASRELAGPTALTERVCELFRAQPEWERGTRPDAFIAASELLLRRVLAGGAIARASALDLLAADACVTWAFELAADEPWTIGGLAERATMRIATVAAEFA